eukprot:457017-Pelagomonas_calceolata.AAC.1
MHNEGLIPVISITKNQQQRLVLPACAPAAGSPAIGRGRICVHAPTPTLKRSNRGSGGAGH